MWASKKMRISLAILLIFGRGLILAGIGLVLYQFLLNASISPWLPHEALDYLNWVANSKLGAIAAVLGAIRFRLCPLGPEIFLAIFAGDPVSDRRGTPIYFGLSAALAHPPFASISKRYNGQRGSVRTRI